MPTQNMYYRFQWAGDATYAARDSDVVPVQVMPLLGAPANGTSITAGKKFTVKGSVEAWGAGGTGRQDQGVPPEGRLSLGGLQDRILAKLSGTQYSQSVSIADIGK